MIEFIEVSKTFGETVAVDKISFKVEAKENLIILGTSGCGKTTTLKMINQLIEPTEGKISIEGKDISKENKVTLRRRIGYVMQNIGLFPHYTVRQNIEIVPHLLKWDQNKTSNRIDELIAKLHLPTKCLELYPKELSGGQQQRVGLARALVADPPLLLMDEPFGALDNVTRASIQQEFKDLAEFKRKTIVMVTHDVQEAFELADRICLMNKGKIMQIGTPKQLLFNPANDFVKNFLASNSLALGFKIIKIDDIWNQLIDAPALNGESLHSSISIWEAMEKLRTNELKQLDFINLHQQQKTASFEELTKAFYQYKNPTS